MLFNNESAILNEEYTSEISQYELGATGGLMHAYEIECAFNEMMESIGIDELKYYTEAKPIELKNADLSKDPTGNKGIVDKIAGFVRMIIQKVQELFNRAVAAFGKIQADKFIQKYGKRIQALVGEKSKMEFKPFKMKCKLNLTNVNRAAKVEELSKTLPAITGNIIDPDSLRGQYVGKQSCSAKEFPTALRNKLYGGETVKDINAEFVAEAYSVIKDYKKSINELNKERVKTVNAFKKRAEAFKKKAKSSANDAEAKLKANEFAYFKENYSIDIQRLSILLRVTYDGMQFCKAVCLKALSEAKVKEGAKPDEKKKGNKPEAGAEAPQAESYSFGPEPGSVSELFAQVEIL
jgi:hypothetical protein